MTRRNSARLSLAAYALVAFGSMAVPAMIPSEAMANNKCGGLNQRVCKKWEQIRGCDKGLHRTKPIGGICTHDNKFIPNPIERKIVGFYEPGRTNCGGLNQRVCKKNEQLRGCDPGFHRTSPVNGICTRENKFVPKPPKIVKFHEPSRTDCGGLNQRVCKKNEQLRGCDPGFHRTSITGGTCQSQWAKPGDFLFKGELQDRAKKIADAMTAHQRVLRDIATCVSRSGVSTFRRAIESKDMNRASAMIFQCVTPDQLRILMTPPGVHGAQAAGFRSISVGVGASSMFGAGLGGEAGVVLALDASASPRFYTVGGGKFGVGAGVSGDIIASISVDPVKSGKSNGVGIGAGGKAIGGIGVGVFFSNIVGSHRPFNGFSVSGGVGASFEIGTVNPTWSKIW